MSKPVSQLERHLGYWLRFVSNHVSHAFRLKVEAHGVTVAEWVILRALLESGETNPSQLAQTIGLTRGAVSKLVDRLVGKRMVVCRLEKSDKRYQRVSLTAAGRELVPILAALADKNDHEFFGHMTAKEQAALADVLKGIVERHGLKHVPVD